MTTLKDDKKKKAQQRKEEEQHTAHSTHIGYVLRGIFYLFFFVLAFFGQTKNVVKH